MEKNKRLIALPMEDGLLCAHFGHCRSFAIVELQDNTIVSIKEVVPPEHVPGLYPRWVAGFGVTDVIAGGMGEKAIQLFNAQNINVFVGAPQKSAEELVKDFIGNKLELSANYCRHDKNHSCGQ
ncbi:MAG: NifB/NifX family molybdenum-iron cluster-binding protein [Bacteroidota bacterium]|jgi:predicted Fe-Mo cluster-binding NifX family protein|nr:NifB/NifX family molybdenum-iron cluster-binding protein [Bacteroidota bacterium]HOF92789.1 NifB/NifX family molybdenum-iron cluster-binding protein [Bacteroidales bacterium]HPL06068.1 NifB/NifX family molybdenum-iron cluster-binding protein [Bacteroidales bacterium]